MAKKAKIDREVMVSPKVLALINAHAMLCNSQEFSPEERQALAFTRGCKATLTARERDLLFVFAGALQRMSGRHL